MCNGETYSQHAADKVKKRAMRHVISMFFLARAATISVRVFT